MLRPIVTLIVLAALGRATAAWAGLPPPNFSTIDPIGVGDNSGLAIGGANPGYDVSVRDGNNQPVPNAVVTLDFTDAHVRAYTVQNAGTTVDASQHTLTRVATTGSTKFAARTAGFDNTNLVHVLANGALLGNVKWRSTDIDAQGGSTGLPDFLYFATRFLTAATAPEVNFDLTVSDQVGLGDFTIFSNEFLAGGSGTYAW